MSILNYQILICFLCDRCKQPTLLVKGTNNIYKQEFLLLLFIHYYRFYKIVKAHSENSKSLVKKTCFINEKEVIKP